MINGKIFPLLISQVIVIWKEGLGPAPPGNFIALRNNYHDTEENLGLLCLRKLVGPFGGGSSLMVTSDYRKKLLRQMVHHMENCTV